MLIEWHDFLAAFALFLVFEGALPFVSPRSWRQLALVMVNQSDRSLRTMALVIMLMGVFLLYLIQ